MMRLAACLSLLALTAAPAAAEPDAKAAAVGKQLWSALGGDDGWTHARYLRYDFVVEREGKKLVTRAHYWDRWSGRYRVDARDKTGPTTVYFDVNTRKGDAYADGAKIADAARAKAAVDGAYEAYINDMYWLLAPYKVFDPGVTLVYAGEDKSAAGEACDVLKLSFGSVGLTPKDLYWLCVDKKSHLVTQRKYVLDGADKPPTTYAWTGWKKVGSIMLSPTRTAVGKPSVIRFESLAVSDKPDEAALTPPK
jgi:hypothetical protein